jgi:hypothetical protein
VNVASEEDQGDEGVGEAYAPTPEHALQQEAVKTEFAAWHHPRKQYVRVNQWCSAVQKLLPELMLGKADPFRYLTLPGNELLDIRALHGVCARAGVALRYLGFNSVGTNTRSQAELALSQSEVRSLSHIDRFSRVIEDRLEAVARERSPAFVQAQQSGPFHAINLDLCDSIAFRGSGCSRGSPIEALAKLLELQLQSARPWLLFITTKAEPALISTAALDGFNRAITDNSNASPEFREALAKLIEANIERFEQEIAEAWVGQDARFLRMFCAGLGKWLLTLLTAASPPREIELLSSCFYQSGPAGPDMLSLAFRCNTPTQSLHDRYAIIPAAAALPLSNEVEIALRLAADLGEIFDLDAKLSSDAALTERLIAQASRLLASARYDPVSYEAWARNRLKQVNA